MHSENHSLPVLPIGQQTFSDLIEDRRLYVDKTSYLFNLVTRGSRYFLSRPRRFGKSLTLSTLEAIFLGRKDLFKGLYIDEMDYAWTSFPVLRFDMSNLDKESADGLRQDLRVGIRGMSTAHQLDLAEGLSLSRLFSTLLGALHQKYNKKVVVLIDEYDAPMIRHITDIPKATANREVLREFYGVLKSEDAHLHFVFLTGVSKFSKVGVFSGLNNLYDLTMDAAYASMCGYTQEELQSYFEPYIALLAESEACSVSQIIDRTREWYNGYRFSDSEVRVYNPFSTLLLFQQKKFKAHWFETGTPTFLIELLKSKQYAIEDTVSAQLSESEFSTYELEDLNPLPLLVQTGYLTIRGYDKEWSTYQFGFPNFEVESSFLGSLLRGYAKNDILNDGYLYRLIEAIRKADLVLFFETLKVFFAEIPYDIQLSNEKYYQSMFYMIFTLIGLRVSAEVRTNRGRIDAVIETGSAVYLFEFKLTGTVSEALAQIQSTEYFQRYCGRALPIVCIGCVFDPLTRNVGEWAVA